jgi:hypothetical protein
MAAQAGIHSLCLLLTRRFEAAASSMDARLRGHDVEQVPVA